MKHLSSGIVGLPNVGKSTLFNALTHAGAEVAAYPFCTIEPNVGVVPVKDGRLDRVAELAQVDTVIYHTVEYVDVAGLVKDASKGAGRGNQFLENVRNCDALVHVVRCFEDPNVAHVSGTIDPAADIRTVNLELILADMETCERALQRLRKQAKREAEAKKAVAALEKIHARLDAEEPVRGLELSSEERESVREIRFLTSRRMLYAANVAEDTLPGMAGPGVDAVRALAAAGDGSVVPICARLEEEVAQLDAADAETFLEDAGLEESGLQRLVRATAALLHLVCFFTFNENEARAWTVPEGTRAQDAAGVIHTDFAEHFIRAEVTAFDDFARAGGKKGAHDQGLTRVEGRDHPVRDGDVIYFHVGK